MQSKSFYLSFNIRIMLQLKDVTIKYGEKTVINHLSLDVDRGQLVCICGESGCGKTSLLNAIMGFVAFEGEILIDGIQVSHTNIDSIRRMIAYVPQELALPQETVKEMIYLPFSLKANHQKDYSDEKVLKEWEFLNLDRSILEKRTTEISGGQRQRVMLSVAGLLHKKLILVDEPTSALDPESAQLVLRYFRYLIDNENVTIVVASHHKAIIDNSDQVVEIKTLNF